VAAQQYTAEGERPSTIHLLIGHLVEVAARLLLTRANSSTSASRCALTSAALALTTIF
jgi:hypothetical protein